MERMLWIETALAGHACMHRRFAHPVDHCSDKTAAVGAQSGQLRVDGVDLQHMSGLQRRAAALFTPLLEITVAEGKPLSAAVEHVAALIVADTELETHGAGFSPVLAAGA